MVVKRCNAGWSYDNDNMANVVCPDYIHTIAYTLILYSSVE